MVTEWGFDEPSDLVDVERIYRELAQSGQPAIYQYAYMEQLRTKAPIVYGRLRDWAQARGLMTWVQWFPDKVESHP